MRKQLRRQLLAFCLIISLLPIWNLTVAAAPKDADRTVKVGIFSLGSFMGWDENGEACGYNIDYLNKIAEVTHWKYEYVDCDNWTTATEMLEKGEIDLLAPAQHTDVLDSKFSYTTQAMCTESAAIYTLSDRDDLLYEDFGTMEKITYGCAKGSTFARKFVEEYAPENGLTDANIKYYDNTTELMQALKEKKVDAIVTNIMFASADVKILGWYSPMSVYYIGQKDKTEFLEEINQAMIQITVEEPSWQAQLFSDYFPVYDRTHISYEEMEFAAKLPTIKVGYFADRKPIAYTDAKTGEYSGITSDILKKISEYSGVQFTYVPLTVDTYNEEYLKENEIYCLANYEYCSEMGFGNVQKSNPYLDTSMVLVSPKEVTIDADQHLVMAIDGSTMAMQQQILENYPNFEIKTYDGLTDCFEAVNEGEADLLLGKQYIIEPYLSKPAYSKMKISQVQGIDSKVCLAVVTYDNDTSETGYYLKDRTFISLVDKCLNRIDSNDLNSIVVSYTSANVYQYSIEDFAYQYRYLLVILLVSILLIIGILAAWIANRQRSLHLIKVKNDQLALAVDKVTEANSAKSQFLAQMSHEIRTPMNAIIGLTTIAQKDVKDPQKMSEYLMKVDGASRILLGIINDVLDMSAIENHKMKIASEEFDLKQLLSSVTTVYYQQCKQKNIDFEMRMQGVTEERLIGDSLRVNQILLNLLSNAVKFTQSGGEVSVLVIQASTSKDMVHMRFIVSDTGCGMTDDLKKRLFNPFEQEDATTAKKHGGSGLGLSITKNLVDLMHGNIQVESKKDVGSVFTVDIPFGMVKKEHRTVTNADFAEIHALIVDDDEDSCEYTSVLLDRLGVKHNYVTNGEAALEELGEAEDRGESYGICFIDWKMPDMDGIAVSQKIREIFGEDTMIIIVSAYDLNEVEEEGKGAGVNYFIPKPLFQSSVFDILMQITNKKYQKVEISPSERHKYSFRGKKILVAEDVALNMEVAVKLLNMVECDVVCAEDGQIAVDMYEKSKVGEFDAILMDINMPVMDGYEAARKIRASAKSDAKTIPIYAMTANAFTEDVTAALDAGMNGHIAKPIETDVLYRTLQQAFTEEKNHE